ncbi:MAG: Asparagine-tRNA ligase [candidate division WWE3 bacterium GW2011_GWB1_42_6]|uniref:Asparagine-tRNA ligase n=1 Tax=candidate division WWE3 bacterium GW2011_GWB1_42_6 TaxID=1619115 RepID=A0A0G1AZS3_UNCKA|nr:MAG: Asparagine-tRNA ligase [candidate division WWE3 bacterium GW2011_GWB1_42_6]
MKLFYINDIVSKTTIDGQIEISCWIKNKRTSGAITFLEIEDSTGSINAIAEKNILGDPSYNLLRKTPIESSVKIFGNLQADPHKETLWEIKIVHFDVINKATKQLSPSPRTLNDPFNKKYANQILNNRHLYIRNSKISSVIKIKHQMLIAIREWFNSNKFTEVDTPILTQSNLYDNNNTFNTDYFGTKAYLSQCAGLYLGAMVPALEKVYTITPAFRKESSKSPRHNPEFYHLKGQMAFYNLQETMKLVEDFIYHTVIFIDTNCSKDLSQLEININTKMYEPPYPVISYLDSIKLLKSNGINIKIGQSLNEKAEQCIADKYNKPTFIMNIPSEIEPFPYSLTDDKLFTKTADLLIPNGFGEILGIAEFIYDTEELKTRMKEKKKDPKENNLEWYTDLSKFGDVPKSGFGMGVERLLRAILKLPHIRDCYMFPRLYGRQPYP